MPSESRPGPINPINPIIPTNFPSRLTRDEARFLKAAAEGDEETIEELLGRVDVSTTCNRRGLTALHLATNNNDKGTVRQLLAADAEPRRADKQGFAPIHLAAWRGYDDVVRAFVDCRVNPSLRDGIRSTPLHWAVDGNRLRVVPYLLRHGAAVDARDREGATPLMWAAKLGHAPIADMLIAADANVEAMDCNGSTALIWAAKKGHRDAVKVLLEKEAEVNAADFSGNTVLMWAAGHGFELIVATLLAKGANAKAGSRVGNTALHGAAGEGHAGVADLLLRIGMADIEAKDENGRTPLSWAARGGKKGVVRFLIDYGAHVNSVDSFGGTPLHHAAMRNASGVAGALLTRGANIEATDTSGWTALHHAASLGHLEVTGQLLLRRASIYATDNDGRTAAQVAVGKGVKDLLTAWSASHPPGGVQTEQGGGTSADVSEHHRHAEHTTPAVFLAATTVDTPPSVLKARNWIQRAKDHLQALGRNKANRRIKVAVIDTGVDLTNHDLFQYEGQIKFLRGTADDNKDRDGHGTLVVQLLFQLAPDIEVYVHKIADTRGSLNLSPDQIEEVADVITQAAQKPNSEPSARGGHRAGAMRMSSNRSIGIDILNMSFGFPDADEPSLDPLRSALQDIHTSNKVIILAAAHNDGGNEAVMWPASERTCVICVNSADGDGNPSSFNPTQQSPRFCTLGEGLELRLTGGQMERAKSDAQDPSKVAKTRIESGTSFATPVAAALVAMILQFVDSEVDGSDLSEKQKQRLKKVRTRQGILRIFQERCVDQSHATRNGYHYIAPWFFSKDMSVMLDTLQRA